MLQRFQNHCRENEVIYITLNVVFIQPNFWNWLWSFIGLAYMFRVVLNANSSYKSNYIIQWEGNPNVALPYLSKEQFRSLTTKYGIKLAAIIKVRDGERGSMAGSVGYRPVGYYLSDPVTPHGQLTGLKQRPRHLGGELQRSLRRKTSWWRGPVCQPGSRLHYEAWWA